MSIRTFLNLGRRGTLSKVLVSAGDFNGKKSWIDVSGHVEEDAPLWEIFERVYVMLLDPTYKSVQTAKIESSGFDITVERKKSDV